MHIVINGIEPQFKIYKMSENVDGKFYIGKTKQPLKDRMYGHRHSHGCIPADEHFADVGWRNVTVEIIDTANDEGEMDKKETEHILKNANENMLNKHCNINKTINKNAKNFFDNGTLIALNTGESVTLRTIKDDILKRFIKTEIINLDTSQKYPIKWDELEEIKKDCVANSIYFKNEDVIRASFGKHKARRKQDEITCKTFIESVNALLKMFHIKVSMSERTRIKGKKKCLTTQYL